MFRPCGAGTATRRARRAARLGRSSPSSPGWHDRMTPGAKDSALDSAAGMAVYAGGMSTPQTERVITCPHCGARATEQMPADACVFFYDCTACGARLETKPRGVCRLLQF